MRGLTASDLVRAWEAGRSRHPVDRGLLLLALACPELSWEHLADLSVGQRNGRLLDLREATLGPTLSGYAKCIHCGEALEFQFTAASVRQPEPSTDTFVFSAAGYRLSCRLPTSRDLAALAAGAAGNVGDVDQARRLLIERCTSEASLYGNPIETDAVPDAALPGLADAMSGLDPGAETRFSLSCFNCGQEFSVLFDIVSYFWTEIDAYAKRLLLEVDVLARTYAWREADILAMSSFRRKHYLDMIGQ
jgi:hypothetical protein